LSHMRCCSALVLLRMIFAVVVLNLFQHDFDGIAGLQRRQVPEFLAGNEAFGFVADIYKHFIIADFHHFAGNDGTFLEVL